MIARSLHVPDQATTRNLHHCSNVIGRQIGTSLHHARVPDCRLPSLRPRQLYPIGADTGTPADDQDYQVPFKFGGKIEKLTAALDPPRLTPQDMKKLSDAERAAQDGN
jgi:hypothetical protein